MYLVMQAQKTDSNHLADSEDSYASEVLGMVIVATSDYFQIQTSGMIKFDKRGSEQNI